MTERAGWSGRFAVITAAVVVVIVYGSLFPFDFQDAGSSAGPLKTLLASEGQRGGRGDIIANILLYIPFGFFAMQVFRRRSGFAQVLLTGMAGMSLSLCMELLQYYVPGRDQSVADVVTNTAGSLVGAVVGMQLRNFRLPALAQARRELSAAALLACWLGCRLFPYVPVIDLHKYWHAVRPLVVSPVLPVSDFYRHTVIWCVLALLLERLCPAGWKRVAFPLLMGGLLGARVAILDAKLSPAEVLGAVVALIAWYGVLVRMRWRVAVLAGLFAIAVVVQGLSPFHFADAARPFSWIPFRGFLRGSVMVNVQSFLEKAFEYGGLVWLLMRAGLGYRGALAAGAGLVFAVHWVQRWLPGRSAEITDVVILVMMGVLVRLLDWESE